MLNFELYLAAVQWDLDFPSCRKNSNSELQFPAKVSWMLPGYFLLDAHTKTAPIYETEQFPHQTGGTIMEQPVCHVRFVQLLQLLRLPTAVLMIHC